MKTTEDENEAMEAQGPDEQKRGEQETDHVNSGKELKDDKIDNDEDLHEAEAGNIGEINAEKDLLDGPANDLIGQPSGHDNDD